MTHTDEEIIIDGVDVAGCVQLVEEPNYPCGLGGECKGWENCYYKQLKRLEQENARLMESGCEQCKHLDLYIKYKQTLQEIKKLCERQDLNQGMRCFEILKVIKKAEVGE